MPGTRVIAEGGLHGQRQVVLNEVEVAVLVALKDPLDVVRLQVFDFTRRARVREVDVGEVVLCLERGSLSRHLVPEHLLVRHHQRLFLEGVGGHQLALVELGQLLDVGARLQVLLAAPSRNRRLDVLRQGYDHVLRSPLHGADRGLRWNFWAAGHLKPGVRGRLLLRIGRSAAE